MTTMTAECRPTVYVSKTKAYYNEWQRNFRRTEAGRRHVRAMNLKKYGLTPEMYDTKLADQGGVCAACGLAERAKNQHGIVSLAVDHDHDTGQIRGLLCMACNRALGMLGDCYERVLNLAIYRERFA
jgi:hypothetical protein